MRKLLPLVLLFILPPVFAGEDWKKNPIGPYSGLNNRDNSFAISASQAQDLLNVELTVGGKSVRKRHGFGTAFTLNQTTSPVHGVYDFFDSNGNEVNLFFSDTNVYGSVGGAAATVLLSTAPNGATWQCTDSLGQAYCVNSSRTGLYKISGSTLSQIMTVVSTGTMITTAVDRLVMGGFSDSTSRIDFSAAGDFTSWGTGSLGSSPVQQIINSPGARIAHLTYVYGRILWFKDTSFGYALIGNQPLQTDWVYKTVAYDVGTNDNTSVYREGILYFRGKDGHIYLFDGNTYQRLSREISGTVALAQTRSQNSWTQSSQNDFISGASSPQGFISSGIVSGSIMPSSFTAVETSSTQFANGTFVNTASTGSFVWISTANHSLFDTSNAWSFENSLNYWSHLNGGGYLFDENGTTTGTGLNNCSGNYPGPRTGTRYMIAFHPSGSGAPSFVVLAVYSAVDNSVIGSQLIPFDATQCTYVQKTFSADLFNLTRRSVYLRMYFDDHPSNYVQSSTFIASGLNFSFYLAMNTQPSTAYYFFVDDFSNGYTPSTGTYTSKSYDTGLTTNTVAVSSIGATINNYSPLISLQTSNDNLTWRDIASGITPSTTTSYVGNRYLRYIASFTVTGSSNALTTLDDVTIVAHSSGTFLSAVNNSPNLTSWDTLGATYQNNGGTVTFYTRGRSGLFLVTDSSPAWVATTPGAVITASTGAYNQVRADFNLNTATDNPTINDFTLNWFEGSAADKSYATYFDDKIMFSAPIGTGTTTNNKTLIFDLLNQTWLLWDLPCNGFYVKANKLYFGSSTGGYIFKYGDVENDNSAAINSYWKSKDFFGSDPFTGQELANISIIGKEVNNSTATVSYTINGSSTSSFLFPLTSLKTVVGLNKNMPGGLAANSSFSVQVGNNAVDQPWEIFGIQVGTRDKTWIPGQ